jgi:hypothetical protein
MRGGKLRANIVGHNAVVSGPIGIDRPATNLEDAPQASALGCTPGERDVFSKEANIGRRK